MTLFGSEEELSPGLFGMDDIAVSVDDVREILQDTTLGLSGRASTAWLDCSVVSGTHHAAQVLHLAVCTFLALC